MNDPRPYPEGRDRVYLSPAHMDIHSGSRGFFVERLGGSNTLGYYDLDSGVEHARVVSPALVREFKALAKESGKKFGQVCPNEVCKKALETSAHVISKK